MSFSNGNSDDADHERLLGLDQLYFLVAILFVTTVVLGVLFSQKHPNQAEYDQVVADKKVAEDAKKALEERHAALLKQVGLTEKDVKLKQPSILVLSESEGFTFASGHAEIPAVFERALRGKIIPSLAAMVTAKSAKVIEVVGHTDEAPLHGGRGSTLDRDLLKVVNGRGSASTLAAIDNTGLAMARATAVAKVLRSDPRLSNRGVIVRAYSAGQTVLPSGTISPGFPGSNPARRRVELRVRSE
ncbi:hypothetical protein EXS71_02990 [Candidatus Uhrbacteria bacterium]|nr:hypothetical protein [Candidatus Uhrbacteria bacterium]